MDIGMERLEWECENYGRKCLNGTEYCNIKDRAFTTDLQRASPSAPQATGTGGLE